MNLKKTCSGISGTFAIYPLQSFAAIENLVRLSLEDIQGWEFHLDFSSESLVSFRVKERKSNSRLYKSDWLFCFGHKKGKNRVKRIFLKLYR